MEASTAVDPTNDNPDAELTAKLQHMQISQLYQQSVASLTGQMIGGFVAVYLLWSQVAHEKLLVWYGIHFLLQLIRLYVTRQYYRQKTCSKVADSRLWARLFVLMIAASALMWGSLFVWLYPAESQLYQIVLAFIVVFTVIVAMLSLASFQPAYITYAIIAIVPVAGRFFIEGTRFHTVIAMLCILATAFVLRFANKNHQATIESLTRSIRLRELANTLQQDKLRIETLNQQLTAQTQSLQDSESRFRSLSEATLESIAIHDNGVILEVNLAATALFGYSRAEMIGMQIRDLITPATRDIPLQFARKDVLYGYELDGVHRDGSVFPIEVQAKSVEYLGQERRLVVARDITERREAEQQALALKLEQERIHILSQFFQNASHEFRTPLSIIQTAVYLNKQLADEQKRHENLDKIQQQSERIDLLVNDLLLMIQLDTDIELHQRLIDINDLLTTSTEQLREDLEAKQLAVTYDLDKDLPMIQVDPQILERAFARILHNALRYTPESGSICIKTSATDDTLSVVIQDSGIAIEEAELPHIFERFYRADKAHNSAGFGVGLSIAKKIIELHNGTIAVRSELDVGTTVTIQLPINTN